MAGRGARPRGEVSCPRSSPIVSDETRPTTRRVTSQTIREGGGPQRCPSYVTDDPRRGRTSALPELRHRRFETEPDASAPPGARHGLAEAFDDRGVGHAAAF